MNTEISVTLGQIQTAHGCASCHHRCDDDQIAAHGLYWCAKEKIAFNIENNRENAYRCCDWTLTRDKDRRAAFVDEATCSAQLPFEADA